jgi:hypothetical protein
VDQVYPFGSTCLVNMSARNLLVLVGLLLLAATASAQTASVQVTDVTYAGSGDVQGEQRNSNADPVWLWQSGDHAFEVTLRGNASRIDPVVCVLVNGTESEQTCQRVERSLGGGKSIRVDDVQWSGVEPGNHSVHVVVREHNASAVVTRETVSITLLSKQGDADEDGLTDAREVDVGTSPFDNDTDADGLADGTELGKYGTDPLDNDTDDDGLTDGRERALGTDPRQRDTDGDGLADGLERNTYETNATNPDTDGDGLSDGAEVNRYKTNPLAADTDDDGLSDYRELRAYDTDPNEIDTDGDGLADGTEVKTSETDPTKADTDNDGLDDGREVNALGTNPRRADTDGDGLSDSQEIAEYETNPTKADTDGDGIPDAREVERRDVVADLELVAAGLLLVAVFGCAVRYRERLPRPAAVRDRVTRDAMDESLSDSEQQEDAGGPPAEGPASESDVSPELLSDEDRIIQLLDANDGRTRQSDIVDEVEWSKSKVSRVLSAMEDDGRIVKIDVGRENIVASPDAVPSGAASPFDGQSHD